MTMNRPTVAIALVWIAFGSAQTTTPAPTPKRPPSQVLYHLLFGHLNFLGQKATETQNTGQPGGDSLAPTISERSASPTPITTRSSNAQATAKPNSQRRTR